MENSSFDLKEISIIRLIEIFIEYQDELVLDEIINHYAEKDQEEVTDSNDKAEKQNWFAINLEFWHWVVTNEKFAVLLESFYQDGVRDEDGFVLVKLLEYHEEYIKKVERKEKKISFSDESSINLIRNLVAGLDNHSLQILHARHFNRLIHASKKKGIRWESAQRKEIYSLSIWAYLIEKNKLNMLLAGYDKKKKLNEIIDDEVLAERYLYRVFANTSIELLREENINYVERKKEYCGTKSDGAKDDHTAVTIAGREFDIGSPIERLNNKTAHQRKFVELMVAGSADNPDNLVQNPDIYHDKLMLFSRTRNLERVQELLEIVIEELTGFKIKKRVAVWLQYLIGFEDLSHGDLTWLAELNDCTCGSILSTINELRELHEGKVFYLSIGNVADLMHEEVSTITKRVRRIITDELPAIERISKLIEEENRRMLDAERNSLL